MAWDDSSTPAQREHERQQRQQWAEYDREHPPPRRGRGPGRWFLPAWEGPDSPQSPIWVSEPGS